MPLVLMKSIKDVLLHANKIVQSQWLCWWWQLKTSYQPVVLTQPINHLWWNNHHAGYADAGDDRNDDNLSWPFDVFTQSIAHRKLHTPLTEKTHCCSMITAPMQQYKYYSFLVTVTTYCFKFLHWNWLLSLVTNYCRKLRTPLTENPLLHHDNNSKATIAQQLFTSSYTKVMVTNPLQCYQNSQIWKLSPIWL